MKIYRVCSPKGNFDRVRQLTSMGVFNTSWATARIITLTASKEQCCCHDEWPHKGQDGRSKQSKLDSSFRRDTRCVEGREDFPANRLSHARCSPLEHSILVNIYTAQDSIYHIHLQFRLGSPMWLTQLGCKWKLHMTNVSTIITKLEDNVL